MVSILNREGGSGPACGHVAVCITRGDRLRRVCVSCLNEALGTINRRELSVNDYLARYEGEGEPPALRAEEADAAGALLGAARELHRDEWDQPATACRSVVRDVARATATTSKDVMNWTLKRLAAEGLPALKRSLRAA